ncbi:uncharacterized protein [Parasteatoda tepidariorum]|uniref:uncharacterized protein n=1 Tax=Parasteatoda tepidariorum TaxID=114398 RepID=UPI0039BC7E77
MSETNFSNMLITNSCRFQKIITQAFSVFDVRFWFRASLCFARYGKQTSDLLVTYGGHFFRQFLHSMDFEKNQQVNEFIDAPYSRTDVEGAAGDSHFCQSHQSAHQLLVPDFRERSVRNGSSPGSGIFEPNLGDVRPGRNWKYTNLAHYSFSLNPGSCHIHPANTEEPQTSGLSEQFAGLSPQRLVSEYRSQPATESLPRTGSASLSSTKRRIQPASGKTSLTEVKRNRSESNISQQSSAKEYSPSTTIPPLILSRPKRTKN